MRRERLTELDFMVQNVSISCPSTEKMWVNVHAWDKPGHRAVAMLVEREISFNRALHTAISFYPAASSRNLPFWATLAPRNVIQPWPRSRAEGPFPRIKPRHCRTYVKQRHPSSSIFFGATCASTVSEDPCVFLLSSFSLVSVYLLSLTVFFHPFLSCRWVWNPELSEFKDQVKTNDFRKELSKQRRKAGESLSSLCLTVFETISRPNLFSELVAAVVWPQRI